MAAMQLLFPSTFKVLTYNIHALHPLIAGDDPHFRVPKILEKSIDYDFIFIQENWIYDYDYLDKLLPSHQFIVSDKSKFFWPLNYLINANGSGLTMIVSDEYKVLNFHEEKFNYCNGWFSDANDCLGSKGFQHIQLEISGRRVDFYNTHLDAGNSEADISTRQKQVIHIIDYIKNHSDLHPIILCGDLNINKIGSKEEKILDRLIEDLDLDIVDWSSENLYDKEVLDYILYRGFEINNNLFGINYNLLGLSDHPPISASFYIK